MEDLLLSIEGQRDRAEIGISVFRKVVRLITNRVMQLANPLLFADKAISKCVFLLGQKGFDFFVSLKESHLTNENIP
jgi:hypothetical protein